MRADLQDVHAGVEREVDVLLFHHLRHDRQAGAARGIQENLQRAAVALKRVGIGAGLPDPPAERLCARLFHRVSGLNKIAWVLRIDRALPGDNKQFFAERYPANPQPPAGEIRAPIHEFER